MFGSDLGLGGVVVWSNILDTWLLSFDCGTYLAPVWLVSSWILELCAKLQILSFIYELGNCGVHVGVAWLVCFALGSVCCNWMDIW
jgi:hypothetical protein